MDDLSCVDSPLSPDQSAASLSWGDDEIGAPASTDRISAPVTPTAATPDISGLKVLIEGHKKSPHIGKEIVTE